MSKKREYRVVSVGGESLVYQKKNKLTGEIETVDNSYVVTGNPSGSKGYHTNRLFRGQHRPDYKLGIRTSPLPHVNNRKHTSGRAVNNIQVIPIWLDKFGKETKERIAFVMYAFKHILHYSA